MAEVPSVCAKIKVENIEPDDTILRQENAERQDYPVSYSPIPNGIVKGEPTSEEDGDDCQLVAYSPLPQGVIKEESEVVDGRDEFISRVDPTSQQEGNRNLTNKDADDVPTAMSLDETPASAYENEAREKRSNKRKRTRNNHRSSGTIPSVSRVLRSQTKSGDTLKNVGDGVRQLGAKELAMVEGVAGAKEQQNTEQYDARSEHSSLEGFNSTDEEDLVPIHSLAGPAQRKKISVRNLSVEAGHSQEKEKLEFKCKNCGRAFKVEIYLKRHLARSCRIEPKFSCDQCAGRQFKRKDELQQHLMRIHLVDKSQLSDFGAGPEIRPALPFKCDKCAKTYKTKDTLSRHLKYECQMDPSFPCALCDYRTKLRGNLRGHLMAIHNVDRSQFTAFGAAAPIVRPLQPFKCEKCGRTFKNKGGLKQHLTYECGRDPSFSCNQCDYRVSFKSSLKRHIINVHAGAGLSQLEA